MQGVLGSISGQGTRPHMLQLKNLLATTKTQLSQINKYLKKKKKTWMGRGSFPGGSVVKSPPANSGDMGSIPGQEDPTFTEPALTVTREATAVRSPPVTSRE